MDTISIPIHSSTPSHRQQQAFRRTPPKEINGNDASTPTTPSSVSSYSSTFFQAEHPRTKERIRRQQQFLRIPQLSILVAICLFICGGYFRYYRMVVDYMNQRRFDPSLLSPDMMIRDRSRRRTNPHDGPPLLRTARTPRLDFDPFAASITNSFNVVHIIYTRYAGARGMSVLRHRYWTLIVLLPPRCTCSFLFLYLFGTLSITKIYAKSTRLD